MNPKKFYNLDISSIQSIHELHVPSAICTNCRLIHEDSYTTICSVCGMNTLTELNKNKSNFNSSNIYNYLKNYLEIHSVKKRYFSIEPVLEKLLMNAKMYVHFCTYTIDKLVLDMLERVASNGVQVAGVVGLSSKILPNIERLNNKFPGVCKIIPWESATENKYNLPHQKFIIIDGMICFAGSMNLTKDGFSKLDQNPPFELFLPVTNIDDIVAINNEYLTPLFVPEKANDIWYNFIDEDI
ncbi:phospholipase D-like domain-containing protein [Atlantibacter hermannii]|uniref:phospholipase D-like domain-containing protein n=1 Tax=Atlantibacter hermannii TaxID=565 RepID=UPI002FD95FE3